MIKKTITYTDYNGDVRTEDFFFHLNKVELADIQLGTLGGMDNYIERISKEKDKNKIYSLFKEIILKSYGEKSPDGRRFIKSEELTKAFEQTEAFVELFMELGNDAEAAAKFVNGIMPNMN